jgi:hypothetical protein
MSLVTDRKDEIFDASSSSRVLFCSSRWYADIVCVLCVRFRHIQFGRCQKEQAIATRLVRNKRGEAKYEHDSVRLVSVITHPSATTLVINNRDESEVFDLGKKP